MKNEKDLSKGVGTTARKRKATATTQKAGRMGNRVKPARGRKGDQPQQPTPRTAGHVANGFLRQKFAPMYSPHKDMPNNEDNGGGIIKSLAILCEKFNIPQMAIQGLDYPYNVLLAYQHTERQFSQKRIDLELLIMENDKGDCGFATKETAGRSCDLYYIPVRPLFKLMRTGKSKLSENLLLAVFSYLYHVAGVPGHRDEETFMWYHTEMVSDWLEDDNGFEDDENTVVKRDLKRAAYEGDYVQKRYWHKYHLEHFAETVIKAKPKTRLEKRCLNIASNFLKLWHDHPTGNIFQHLSTPNQPDDDEDDDNDDYGNTIYAQEYISFIHCEHDVLYENIYANIQTEFNEKTYMQEHSAITVYDNNRKENGANLDYPTKFFELADDLCNILIHEL